QALGVDHYCTVRDTYKDYLNAWTHFCTSQAVTDADRRIVRESVRPYSVVNPCKALK
ncbi:hypothetical protein K0995_004791, partial [Salmonella enterica subsp. enterica serovar Heidelberg]|nr:hypothetical protein [Salmonella enterica subsp. enterica serovar Heidelberg]